LLTWSTPEVASEIIDGLLATGKHEIVILSRKASDRKKHFQSQATLTLARMRLRSYS
jgi:hypothetical protein